MRHAFRNRRPHPRLRPEFCPSTGLSRGGAKSPRSDDSWQKHNFEYFSRSVGGLSTAPDWRLAIVRAEIETASPKATTHLYQVFHGPFFVCHDSPVTANFQTPWRNSFQSQSDSARRVPQVDKPHRDHCAGLTATVATGVADFNCSRDVRTLCQRTGSLFVPIAAEGSE